MNSLYILIFSFLSLSFFEELEEVLISSDVGVMTVMDLIDELRLEVQRKNIKENYKLPLYTSGFDYSIILLILCFTM